LLVCDQRRHLFSGSDGFCEGVKVRLNLDFGEEVAAEDQKNKGGYSQNRKIGDEAEMGKTNKCTS